MTLTLIIGATERPSDYEMRNQVQNFTTAREKIIMEMKLKTNQNLQVDTNYNYYFFHISKKCMLRVMHTLKCVSIGTLNITTFPFVPNGK